MASMVLAGMASPTRLRLAFSMAVGSSSSLAEAIGVLTNLVWVFSAAFIFFKIVDVVWGNRVTAKDEIAGLDITEMGTPGYVLVDPIEVKRAEEDHLMHFGPGVPRKGRVSINASANEKKENVPVSHS